MKPHCVPYILYRDIGYGTLCSTALSIGVVSARVSTVKSFFKTKEEFISLLKSVDKISFTEARNLFNYKSKKRQALIDLTGTDAPDKFTLEAHYKKDINLFSFIKQLIDSKKGSELKNLIIEGTDENDFNFIFNVDSFVRKIEVQCEKENNGKYNPESVRKQLIKAIEE